MDMTDSVIDTEMLRQSFGLGRGSEIHLPLGSQLTPAAIELIAERGITVRFIDALGRVYTGNPPQQPLERIHPLTGQSTPPGRKRPASPTPGKADTELLTHLDGDSLVPKTHPRIALRGKLDTLIAFTVLAQCDFDREQRFPWLHPYLADLRSHMGNLLKAEVTGEEMPAAGMGGIDLESLHAFSQNPLRHLGHDHIVPEETQGRNVALLNVLRALCREVELGVVRAFTGPDGGILRPDLLTAANRLSSAIYVLMLLTLLAEAGKKVELETLAL